MVATSGGGAGDVLTVSSLLFSTVLFLYSSSFNCFSQFFCLLVVVQLSVLSSSCLSEVICRAELAVPV